MTGLTWFLVMLLLLFWVLPNAFIQSNFIFVGITFLLIVVVGLTAILEGMQDIDDAKERLPQRKKWPY